MSKELIKRFVEKESIRFGAWWLQARQGLKPEGKKPYWNLIRKIIAQEEIRLSEHIDILSGYDCQFSIEELEKLKELNGRNSLVIANHSHLNPLEGYGETLLTSYYIKETTGKEINWVRERRKSPVHELLRQSMDYSLNTIPVNSVRKDPKEKIFPVKKFISRLIDFPLKPIYLDHTDNGVREILRRLEKEETVGIYPEGGISHTSQSLSKAHLVVGKIIFFACKNGIPVVCVATQVVDDILYANFSVLDNNRVLELRESTKNNRNEGGQNIVDHAMETIAQHLPPNRRGYYSYITI